MIAVDTNVLVRLLTGDDPKQYATAKSLFSSGHVWIAKTVLLETDWVLRSLYGFDEASIRDAFVGLLGLDNVYMEDQDSVGAALALTGQMIEFADALHLSSRPAGAKFYSFDRSLVRDATKAGESGVSIPSSK